MDKVREFINRIAPLIKAEATARNYRVCSTVIAQAIIESRYGESGLAKYHNYFGLKCGSSWKGASVNMKTKEEINSTMVTIKDNFRAYSDMAEGVKGYYDFISTKRYQNLKTASNYKQYAEMLKVDGYATSSSYVKTLCDTVEKYSLNKYDDNDSSLIGLYPILQVGSKGNYVIAWQNYLNGLGYPCGKVDGIFGNRTLEALKAYQCDRGLVPDGIVDEDEWNSVKIE